MSRILFAATLFCLAACGANQDPAQTPAPAPPPVQPQSPPPTAGAVNAATWTPAPTEPGAFSPVLARAQVMLDRALFSPGVIDGLGGDNTGQAIAAFERANNLTVDGELDETVFAQLVQADSGPALVEHVITAEDVAGPFVDTVPQDMAEQARLTSLAYTGAAEALAERFHMDEDFLRQLNPSAGFLAGERVLVAAASQGELPAPVARIEINKAERAVRVFDADGRLMAFYPATIGSAERPSLSGEMEVRAVAPEPTYTYDPRRLSFGEGDEVLTLAAGPNNPVGSVWIDLTEDTYGIHGTPDPSEVGKTFSNGCVRLTNWNAEQLAASVEPGVAVAFV